MGGRAYRVGVVTPPANPRGRAYRAGVAGAALAPAPHGRVYRAAAVGSLPVQRHGRVYRAGTAGTASVVLAPFEQRTVEPMSVVELTALLSDGTPAEYYTWRQISGPPVAFTGTGHTRSFTAPSAMPPGATVVIGVRATVGDTTSAEQAATVTVLPQITWIRTHADPAWRGCKITL